MDFNFTEIQLHWRKAAADFVRSCAPLQADGASGAYWLERAVADSRRVGVFDCAWLSNPMTPDLICSQSVSVLLWRS